MCTRIVRFCGLAMLALVVSTELAVAAPAASGHRDLVGHLAWSADGLKLASGDRSGTVKLWNTQTGQCLWSLTAHKNDLDFLAFGLRDRVLVSASRSSGAIKVWNARTGRLIRSLGSGGIEAAAVGPQGREVAALMGKNRIKVWDLRTGRLKRTLALKHASGDYNWLAFDHRGRLLVLTWKQIDEAQLDSQVTLRRVRTGQRLLTTVMGEYRGPSVALSFRGTRQLVALGVYRNPNITLWDVRRKRRKRLLSSTYTAGPAAFSSNGKLLAIGGGRERTIRVWDTQRGIALRTLYGQLGGMREHLPRHLRTQKIIFDPKGHDGAPVALAFGPKGRRLASAGTDNEIKIWNWRLGKVLVNCGKVARARGTPRREP